MTVAITSIILFLFYVLIAFIVASGVKANITDYSNWSEGEKDVLALSIALWPILLLYLFGFWLAKSIGRKL